jgi:hypothetical protein
VLEAARLELVFVAREERRVPVPPDLGELAEHDVGERGVGEGAQHLVGTALALLAPEGEDRDVHH